MTKEELEQLSDLRKEIAELEWKIQDLSRRCSRVVCDKVQASSRDFPYTETSVKIEGVDYVMDARTRHQIMAKRALLQQRKDQAEILEIQITQYINSIPDSKIRRLIEYKYIDGYTWERIGKIFHCDRTTAEKKVSNYLRGNM